MYSYDRYKFDLRNASPVTVSSTPADRDAALLRTYKKTSAEMAMSSNVRRDEQTSKALLLQHNRRLREAVEEEKNRDSRIWRPRKTLGGEPVWRHRFRERRVDKEVRATPPVEGADVAGSFAQTQHPPSHFNPLPHPFPNTHRSDLPAT